MTKEEVIRHWVSCLPDEIEDKAEEERLIKDFLSAFEYWEEKEEDIDSIISLNGTRLMEDYFFKTKMESFLESPITDIPAIIVVPKGTKKPNPFLMGKYSDPSFRWEIADGHHRIEVMRVLGFNKVRILAPVERKS